MNRPTVSLQLIVKDEFDAVATIVGNAINYFDEVNLTVSDRKTATALAAVAKGVKQVNVKYRKWTDRFDEARNANFAMSTTDYCFWIDADDFFDFSTIPELVKLAADNQIDEIFLPYDYAQDEQGKSIAKHYRERLVKRGAGEWKGWVHETYIIEQPKTSHVMESPVVRHDVSPDHAASSTERNHVILAKAFEATDDPRYLMYLGGSFFSQGEYEKAISLLIDFLPRSGNPDDIYRSLSFVSEAAYHLGRTAEAFEYATRATVLNPAYPMAYWLLAQYSAEQKQWREALEWVKVSIAKPDPKSLSVWDPTGRERAIFLAAQAEFMLHHYNNALAWLRKIPNNPDAQDLMEGFQAEADAETFIKLLPNLRKFFHDDYHLWESLCHNIQYDKRTQWLRYQTHAPKTWDDKSIVIFCGEGYEEWGPHTLDKGMGGSEEAVIYLSRELSRLGYEVTVFGEVPHRMADMTVDPTEYLVHYRPWKELDARDDFNVFISWRAPQFLEFIKAKVKLADIHDVIPKEHVRDADNTTFMFKTDYHKSLYDNVISKVVGNGIVKEQFKDKE